ncbi:MAG TPA: hypothetical protein VEK11_00390 [Thermoanaerobaculia bacterium]|nr:hypothetical protein [Thermoanaerobaculia bacterium]
MTRRARSIALVVLLWAHSSVAEDCSVQFPWFSNVESDVLCLNTSNDPDDWVMVFAAQNWNYACYTGTSMPDLQVGCSSGTMVEIVYDPGSSNSGCGLYQGGADGSGLITLYQYGYDAYAGKIVPCADNMVDTLTHELGHALGLDNVLGSECYGHIMGPRMPWTREILADDCQAIDELWTTTTEQKPPPDSTPCGDFECNPSPIIISLRGDYHLTSAEEGVSFDIDADGMNDRISWTRAGAELAFLALDRNGNGRIDDGSELFGNHTVLRSGVKALDGFDALADFDENADQTINANDAVWNELRLWFDRNHDGNSALTELKTVRAAGITAIGTEHRWIGRVDQHGNAFRFQGEVVVGTAKRQCYDVFFTRTE